MSWYLWAALAAICIPLLWFALKIGISLAVPPEKSGREFLKRQLRQQGVDVSRIPDAALIELVERQIKGAKAMAAFSRSVDKRNWRANLVQGLEFQSGVVADILNGRRTGSPLEDDAYGILTRYRVIEHR
jgi:hypothetical protein